MTQIELANNLINSIEGLITDKMSELVPWARAHVYHRLIRSHVEGLEDIADASLDSQSCKGNRA
jgi:hypothetical protein